MGRVKDLRDRLRGCLTGLAIGETIGRPFQGQTAQQIAQDAIGKKGPEERVTLDLTTALWQQNMAVALSLDRQHGLSQFELARHIATFVNEDPNNDWRTATCQMSQDFLSRFQADEANTASPPFDFQAPEPTPERPDNDNEVATRVVPLAMFLALRHDPPDWPRLTHDVMRLGLITHGDPRASFGALAVATIIVELLQSTKPYEATLAKNCTGPHCQALANVLKAEKDFSGFRPQQPKLSDQLLKLFDLRLLRSARAMRESWGSGATTLESIPFTIGLAVTHAEHFREGVLAAARAGGDSRRNAALVGAMIGTNVGLAGIPAEWLTGLRSRELIWQLADTIAVTAWSADL